ncbi:MAG TPA: RidA family protein [Bacillota bacterium]|nr:RidA family protein [Bacillota bacterium]
MKTNISSSQAPQAIGPYSQAILAGNLLFISGQLGLTPGGAMAAPDAPAQARQALENIKSILSAAGLSMVDVVKTTVFLIDLNDFASVNQLYEEYFQAPYPARACVQVAALPKGGRVEIEAMAVKN